MSDFEKALESAKDAGLTTGTDMSNAYISGYEMGREQALKEQAELVEACDVFIQDVLKQKEECEKLHLRSIQLKWEMLANIGSALFKLKAKGGV